ncbi:nitroreductase/quinone reductase family protein [Chloroflexota bacterium]
MSTYEFRPPKVLLRLLKLPPQFLYKIGLGPIYGRFVLLLTTIGRRSGKPRVTPLQYEEIDGDIYVASVRGQKADWYRNLLVNPKVEVQVKSRRFQGIAEARTDPKQIAEFLSIRQQRHPTMMKLMFSGAGLPAQPTPEQLEEYAEHRTLVVIRPATTENRSNENNHLPNDYFQQH